MHDTRIGQLFYLVHDLWRQTRRWQDVISNEKGLTSPQFRVMAQLTKCNGQSQSELANNTETDPMTMSGILERLEAKGFVSRAPHPSDSRAKIVYVTDEARAIVNEVRANAMTREPELFEGISDADFQTTLAVLARVSANVGHAHATPSQEAPK